MSESTGLPDAIRYYCKDCRTLTDVKRFGKHYVYMCKTCGTKNVAFGTLESLTSFFKLNEEGIPEKKKEKKPQKSPSKK